MIYLNFKDKKFTILEKFFIERALELLHRNTLDSYKVRLMILDLF